MGLKIYIPGDASVAVGGGPVTNSEDVLEYFVDGWQEFSAPTISLWSCAIFFVQLKPHFRLLQSPNDHLSLTIVSSFASFCDCSDFQIAQECVMTFILFKEF